MPSDDLLCWEIQTSTRNCWCKSPSRITLTPVGPSHAVKFHAGEGGAVVVVVAVEVIAELGVIIDELMAESVVASVSVLVVAASVVSVLAASVGDTGSAVVTAVVIALEALERCRVVVVLLFMGLCSKHLHPSRRSCVVASGTGETVRGLGESQSSSVYDFHQAQRLLGIEESAKVLRLPEMVADELRIFGVTDGMVRRRFGRWCRMLAWDGHAIRFEQASARTLEGSSRDLQWRVAAGTERYRERRSWSVKDTAELTPRDSIGKS
ncbi:hypothetical protein ANO11243_093660 [Dothideomycetidae sp. 11243]|nr:hypothetical protein ANO11243_093660 [fungal sp. No.11243]